MSQSKKVLKQILTAQKTGLRSYFSYIDQEIKRRNRKKPTAAPEKHKMDRGPKRKILLSEEIERQLATMDI